MLAGTAISPTAKGNTMFAARRHAQEQPQNPNPQSSKPKLSELKPKLSEFKNKTVRVQKKLPEFCDLGDVSAKNQKWVSKKKLSEFFSGALMVPKRSSESSNQ